MLFLATGGSCLAPFLVFHIILLLKTSTSSIEFDASRFALANSLKDVSYYRDFTRDANGSATDLADALFATLERAVAAGHGDRMVSALLDPEVARAWRGE